MTKELMMMMMLVVVAMKITDVFATSVSSYTIAFNQNEGEESSFRFLT